MKFDKNLEYKTRGGDTVKYVGLRQNRSMEDPHVFNVFDSEGGFDCTVNVYPDGRFVRDQEHSWDILPPKKTVYVNFYPNGVAYHYDTEKLAIEMVYRDTAIAVAVPVEVDV